MATYPYTSGQGALVKAFEQFRKVFPPVVDAATLKRFNIAPANESYIINIFRFLGLIDEDGKKVDGVTDIFFHSEEDFRKGLGALVESAYSELFSERGESAWTEERDTLSTWFRVKDKTSDLIGGRQASTFLTLSALAGHGEPPRPVAPAKPRTKAPSKPAGAPRSDTSSSEVGRGAGSSGPAVPSIPSSSGDSDRIGLTVRVEVNLPATGTPEVYDAIFASIRKNLIDP